MGRAKINMIGGKFGRWTVVAQADKPEGSKSTGLYWLCKCECGNESVKYGVELRSRGGSCGCLKSELGSIRMAEDQLRRHGTAKDRFFSRFRVCDSGCWEWTAHRDKDGYGILPSTGASLRAHRFSYEIHKGEIPHGMVVCHHCDNPSCVNPDHLFIGSTKDNCTDMLFKGRDAIIGSRNNKAKLTESDVPKIRADARSYHAIASDYGVSISTIKRIKSGKLWKHCNDL